MNDTRDRYGTEISGVVDTPWGSYEILSKNDRYAVKRLIVYPGEALSLQTHVHREEHWVVAEGAAKIQLGTVTTHHTEGAHVHVPQNVPHRLSNPGKIPLHVVEVQYGSYLEEDDIVRLEDKYNRHQVQGDA